MFTGKNYSPNMGTKEIAKETKLKKGDIYKALLGE